LEKKRLITISIVTIFNEDSIKQIIIIIKNHEKSTEKSTKKSTKALKTNNIKMNITAKKCCIRFDPPTLILYYELHSSGKIHRRSIPIREKETKKSDDILKELNETHHSKYLQEFNNNQLKRLMKKLIEKQPGLQIDLEEKKSNDFDLDIEKTDLNKLDDDTLNVVKEKMNESFEQNKVKPGDKEWQYDVEVDFEEQDDGEQIEGSAWDDEDESDLEF